MDSNLWRTAPSFQSLTIRSSKVTSAVITSFKRVVDMVNQSRANKLLAQQQYIMQLLKKPTDRKPSPHDY